MPVIRSSKSDSAAPRHKLVLKYNTRKVVVHCPETYADALSCIKKHFKLPKAELRVDMAEIEPGSVLGAVELLDDSWDLLFDCKHTPVFEVRDAGDTHCGSIEDSRVLAGGVLTPQSTPSNEPTFEIRVWDCKGLTLYFRVRGSTRVSKILNSVETTWGLSSGQYKCLHSGERVLETARIADYVDAKTAELYPEVAEFFIYRAQLGGKPVIYLFSPQARSATVQLQLVEEWSFSAIYPVTPVSRKDNLETITWDVQVGSNGDLHDNRTGADVSYLYWEATTNPSRRPLTPPLHEQDAFRPCHATLTPSNAVLLALEDLPAYLDAALKAMTLHTEARTSFITYWLPSLNRHKHIALRFLPQAQYEHAAPMNVEPAPDVITRVFMLFRGVDAEEVSDYTRSVKPDEWKDVVGIDRERALNQALFRVLEWGGMEVNV